jgi:hypothetical protein
MKRLKSIVGAAILFFAAIAIALLCARPAHVFAQAAPPKAPAATTTNAPHSAEPAGGTIVIGGSLNGSLNPPEDSPWRHWLR